VRLEPAPPVPAMHAREAFLYAFDLLTYLRYCRCAGTTSFLLFS
jgi:hypothetical protein